MNDDESRRAAAENEQRHRIVEAAENALLIIDGAGIIERANAEAERIFGYSPGALNGRSIERLDCSQIAAAGLSLQAPASNMDPLCLDTPGGDRTARRADGSAISIHTASTTLDTPRGRLMLLSVREGNRRRAARDEAEADWSQLDSSAPHAGIGRWRYDLTAQRLWWSDEIFRIYGLPVTRCPSIEAALGGYDKADAARIAELIEGARHHGKPYRDEARIIRPDGSVRVVIHGGEAERAPDGSIVAIAGFFQDVTEHKNAQRERQRLSEYVTHANQAGKVGIWELDLRTNISAWDRNMYTLYGICDTTRVPTFELWTSTLHPHDRERAIHEIKSDIAEGQPSDSEFRIIREDGETHTIRSLATIVNDASGAAARIIGTDWDVTEMRFLADALREEKEALTNSEARYRALSEAMPQLVWVVDAGAKLEYVNSRWSQYTGLSLQCARAAGLAAIVDAADAATITESRDAKSGQEGECEVRLRRADGVLRWHLIRSVRFCDATGEAGKWIITATDIEERKAAERTLAVTVAELEHRARHDSMTDLPNRMLLTERLSQAITQANRAHGGVIVLYLDLDRFKAVNDTLGHAAGDIVLKETSLRISGTLRAGDTASRVGGDEFIVVCSTSGPGDEVAQLATRLITAIAAPIAVGAEHIAVEASVGISVYPADGFDAETLIRKADAAMYSAKQHGRSTFRRYSSETHVSIVAAAEFEAELRHAIAADQLVVYYQPIVDLPTGFPLAAEALVRWQHPVRGLVPPGDFIPFAEERGLMAQIGDVVLRSACTMLERLRLAGRDDIRIGVNVSAHQFGKAGFIDGIVGELARHVTDPRRLSVEITESVVMRNTRATIATLDELRALGISLSIDDFGTGYSSLAYIKKFPISTLKIDRSFVREVAEDKTDQAIAKTIITLAHSLGMRVVAEGVETQAQLAVLRSFDIDSVQGYLFSRPLPPDEFERFIRTCREKQAFSQAFFDLEQSA